MDEMFAALALIADNFLEDSLSRVETLVHMGLDELQDGDIEENDLQRWLVIIHFLLDDFFEQVPFGQRQVVLEHGLQVTNVVVPLRTLSERFHARVEQVAAAIRVRVAEGKLGGLLGEDLLESIQQAVAKQVRDFIWDLDTLMSVYDRLFMRQVTAQVDDARWAYDGPRDSRNRVFCRSVLDQKQTFDERGIEKLNLHPDLHAYVPPNVMTLCGGYGCRHMFVPVTKEQAQIRGLQWH